jgi:hypothetical protein
LGKEPPVRRPDKNKMTNRLHPLAVAALAFWMLALAPASRAQELGPLASPEQEAMTDAIQNALEFNATRHPSEWVNPDTGRSGSAVPVRTFENAQGQPCREFVTAITIGGREEQGYGTACRQPDGDWQVVSDDEAVSPPAPSPRAVATYPPPERYYAYPTGFYDPSRIFLSFSTVYRTERVHRGTLHLGGPAFRSRYPPVIRERVFVGPRVYRPCTRRPGWRQR